MFLSRTGCTIHEITEPTVTTIIAMIRITEKERGDIIVQTLPSLKIDETNDKIGITDVVTDRILLLFTSHL